MKIIYSKTAQEDLNNLVEFILDESPRNAMMVLDRIENHLKLLTTQPEMGRPGRVPGTRELIIPKTPFIVPYQVRYKNLLILRVYHSARKWPERFD